MRRKTLYDVMIDDLPIDEAIVETGIPGLHLVPAEADLSGVELELGQTARRAFRLRDALAAVRDQRSYAHVLIDCPPSLNLLTVNGMTAADAVLVPLQCEFFALEGLTQLLRTVEQVRTSLNPSLEIQGVVLTMYERGNSLSGQVAEGRTRPPGRSRLRHGDPPQRAGFERRRRSASPRSSTISTAREAKPI